MTLPLKTIYYTHSDAVDFLRTQHSRPPFSLEQRVAYTISDLFNPR